MREVGGWSAAAGAAATEAGLRGGVEGPDVAGSALAGLTSRAGTEGSGGAGAMREVGGWSDAAGAAVAEAGFAGGWAGVVRGCSGGVARNVTASRCEAEGTRDSVTRGARRAGDAVEAGGTPGTVGTGGVPDETTAAGFAGGAPGAGVFVSAGFSTGGRAGSEGAGVICAVGTSDETDAR